MGKVDESVPCDRLDCKYFATFDKGMAWPNWLLCMGCKYFNRLDYYTPKEGEKDA